MSTISVSAERIIELKELRIGSVLEYKGKYVEVTSLSLDIDDEYTDLIGFCEVGKLSNEISDWNRALAADLNRVPLTPEILEKAGFIFHLWCDVSAFYKTSSPERHFVDLEGGRFLYYLDRVLYDKEFEEAGIEIKYIHQLQNLYFAFTGEELEINL